MVAVKAIGRILGLDALRGASLLCMAAYHLAFDLAFFRGYALDVNSGALALFARAVAASFLFIAGVSLSVSDSRFSGPGRGYHHSRRGTLVFCAGLLVTVVTSALFPANAVHFGILHAIGLSTLLFWPLAARPRAAVALACAVVAAFALLGGWPAGSPWLLLLGFPPSGYSSFDFVPLVPWAAPFLLGLGAGNAVAGLLAGAERRFSGKVASALSLLGRNSLAFYLLHQPVLVSMVLLLG